MEGRMLTTPPSFVRHGGRGSWRDPPSPTTLCPGPRVLGAAPHLFHVALKRAAVPPGDSHCPSRRLPRHQLGQGPFWAEKKII